MRLKGLYHDFVRLQLFYTHEMPAKLPLRVMSSQMEIMRMIKTKCSRRTQIAENHKVGESRTVGQNDPRIVSDMNGEWSEDFSFPLESLRLGAY
jgi:hypothetical protein